MMQSAIRTATYRPALRVVSRAMSSSSSSRGGSEKKKAAHPAAASSASSSSAGPQQQHHQRFSAAESKLAGMLLGTDHMGGKSFPRFRGEGGVIESNKMYVHPNATNLNARPRPTNSSAEALRDAFKGDHWIADEDMAGFFKEGGGVPRAVQQALRSGFVGPRYTETSQGSSGEKSAAAAQQKPGRRPFDRPEGGPTVIHLDGMVFIVSSEKV